MEEKIIKILNEWLRKNNFDTQVDKIDKTADYFGWHPFLNTIACSIYYTKEEEIRWKNLMEECEILFEIPTFVSSFLHEVGHSITYFTFDEEIRDKCDDIIDAICEEPEIFIEDTHNIYYHLPTEIAATKWAVNFINENIDKVSELVYTLKTVG